MSDTPRTDAAQMAAIEHGTGNVYRVGCDIERELNAANKRIDEIEKSGVYDGRPIDKTYLTIHSDVLSTMVSEKAYDPQATIRELQDRIKRLERLVDGVHYIDGVHLEDIDGLNWFNARTAAKEDKL